MSNRVVHVAKGAVVNSGGRRYCIRGFVDTTRVRVLDLDSQTESELRIADLTESTCFSPGAPDLDEMPEKQWQEALRRYEVIRPLLDKPDRTAADVAEVADREAVSSTTLYGWMQKFAEHGVVTALLRQRRKDRGSTKLAESVEEVIKGVIEDFHMTSQQRTVEQSYRELKRRCRTLDLPIPHKNTYYDRVKAIPLEEAYRQRKGRNAALKYRARRGKFPDAEYPYSVLQIDHTQVDLTVVDEELRRAIGRPWITVAVDIFSRLMAGYYISLDPPGSLGTGMCLANAILPKEPLLEEFGIDAQWPCHGLPRVIHADNAKEFRGNTLGEACRTYGIDLQFRKVKKPNYGGHIERLLGTFMKEIQALPGSTFSNPKAKGDYDTDRQSALTLRELEEWLLHLAVGMYHNKVHSQLETTPLKKYEQGILGTDEQPGIGYIPMVQDPLRLRLDFMPMERKPIRSNGIVWDYIHYQADVLHRWIEAREPNDLKRKRRFVFRRDPRDISRVYFYDPDAEQYFEIPYADTRHPPITLWELKKIRATLREQQKEDIDEEAIFDAYHNMRNIEETAKRKTRSARLSRSRRIHGQQAAKKAREAPTKPEKPKLEAVRALDDIKPFDEVEDL
ncbi:Mu transposase C-terminal domain-containing protein [Natronospira bacteriovora]|uniref:Mu transposase C-terminal domain-containing protein n=1 Tax=Natronospira bacteriovora TaxID=3069753 RepID=A0ABU0W712_9GAMM|nr:Mu transposase C-terminal domain-containing protein [Natronospira sp. AB-CW4]MDQ2069817.1 Mu transposase C-terminal domain-containing protein [Natronospira sp. AB-CW4]